MKYFDSNCCIGQLSVPLPKHVGNAGELDELLKSAGIDEALVYHIGGKEYSPAESNQWILDEVKNFPNLHPCWCVMPHHTDEMPPAKELMDMIRDENIRAVRVFPKTQNWSLSEWSSLELLNALGAFEIPLFIDYSETSPDQLYSICDNHPKLPVVLAGAPFRFSRLIYALLMETKNLYLETSQFQLHSGIEDVCNKFGASRLLFGTSVPDFSPGPSVMAIKYAGISDNEKAMIAGGNLKNLLNM
jgi:hypothetical protein